MPPKQKPAAKTFESALTYFRAHGFDVQEMPGVANQIQIRKYGCGAVLARKPDGRVDTVVRPGCLVGGEIATLIDRGYQKFLVTPRLKIAATAAHLKSLHAFQEEVWEATGKPDYYNLALGTISDLYLYDRVKGREPEPETTSESY
ncbi:MAG: hypothetical protein WA708_18740 [Acidobacteriaceae bacterium]